MGMWLHGLCGTVQILQVWVWDCAGMGVGLWRYGYGTVQIWVQDCGGMGMGLHVSAWDCAGMGMWLQGLHV